MVILGAGMHQSNFLKSGSYWSVRRTSLFSASKQDKIEFAE